MTKAELRTGMMVAYRNGDKRIVVMNTADGDGFTAPDLKKWKSFSAYTDDLRDVDGDTQYDIMDVYMPNNKFRVLNTNLDADYTRVWHREEARRMTLGEVQTILGFAIEIVG